MAGDHENIIFQLNEVPELFDTTLSKATITDIDGASNTADLNSEKFGTLTDIDIFYHCPGDETVDDGYLAFDVNDQVILLSKNAASGTIAPEHKIIGHWDGVPRLCEPPVVIFSILEYYTDPLGGATEWCTFIDPQTGNYAQGIKTDGGSTITDSDWPVKRSLLDNFYDNTQLAGSLDDGGVSQGSGLKPATSTVCYTESECNGGSFSICRNTQCPVTDTDSIADPVGLCGGSWTQTETRTKCCEVTDDPQFDKGFCSYDPPGDDPPYDILFSYTTRDETAFTRQRDTCGDGNYWGSWKFDINGYTVYAAATFRRSEDTDYYFEWDRQRTSCTPSAGFDILNCSKTLSFEDTYFCHWKTTFGDLLDITNVMQKSDWNDSGTDFSCLSSPGFDCGSDACSGYVDVFVNDAPTNRRFNYALRRCGVVDKVFICVFAIMWQLWRKNFVLQTLTGCDQCTVDQTNPTIQNYVHDELAVVSWRPQDDETFDPTILSPSADATEAVGKLIEKKYPNPSDAIYEDIDFVEFLLTQNFKIRVRK